MQIEGDGLEVELAGFNFGEVQNVVDDGEQRLGGLPDEAEMFALFGGEVGIEDEFGHAQNSIHGRANLVVHGRQESARPRWRLRHFLGPTQLDSVKVRSVTSVAILRMH